MKFNVRFLPKLYSFLPMGNATVYHCRLRLDLSALNFHRFSYNFINIKSCPTCNHHCEDTAHFLFHCPAFAVPRAVLMESLSNHLPDNIIQNHTILQNFILFGSAELDLQTNLLIFSSVFSYIEATGRLVNKYPFTSFHLASHHHTVVMLHCFSFLLNNCCLCNVYKFFFSYYDCSMYIS